MQRQAQHAGTGAGSDPSVLAKVPSTPEKSGIPLRVTCSPHPSRRLGCQLEGQTPGTGEGLKPSMSYVTLSLKQEGTKTEEDD